MEGHAVGEAIQHGDEPKGRLRWFLGACALIAGGGLLADHVWWNGAAGTSIAERVGRAIGVALPLVIAGIFCVFFSIAVVKVSRSTSSAVAAGLVTGNLPPCSV